MLYIDDVLLCPRLCAIFHASSVVALVVMFLADHSHYANMWYFHQSCGICSFYSLILIVSQAWDKFYSVANPGASLIAEWVFSYRGQGRTWLLGQTESFSFLSMMIRRKYGKKFQQHCECSYLRRLGQALYPLLFLIKFLFLSKYCE